MKPLERIKQLLTLELSPATGRYSVFAVTVVVLSVMLPSVLPQLLNPVLYRQGEVANYTVRAPRDFLIEDTLSTERRRTEELEQVRRVFTLDYRGKGATEAQLEAIFAAVKSLRDAEAAAGGPQRELRGEFERKFNLELEGEEWSVMLASNEWEQVGSRVLNIVVPVLRRGIIVTKRPLVSIFADGQHAVLQIPDKNIEREIPSPNAIYDLEEAAEVIEASLPPSGFGRGEAFDRVVLKLSRLLLRPNVNMNQAETEARLQEAADSVETIFYRIRRGEVIVRAGDVINASQERRLAQLEDELRTDDLFTTWGGYFILTSLVLLSAYTFVAHSWPGYVERTQDLAVVSCTLVGSFFLLKLFSILATSLSNSFVHFEPSTFILITPIAAGGILLQVIIGSWAVLLYILSFGILTGVFLENSWMVLTLVLVGNIVGAISVKSCSRRSAFIWAGLRVAAANMIVVFCFLLLYPDYTAAEKASRVLWGIVGGLFSGVLGAGLTPIAEVLGRYITDIKLLELASLDQPLLRDLSVQAPGTWSHSMIIGQMGEAAAESIGANPLLTRVGAYYHDIGKSKKPAYFVENQTKENRHDKLTPSMSALIIKKHVKDGIELAEQHNLPRAIADFIPQHHGTSLIEYFYVKAHKDAEEGESIDESHYRYGGPKPQSKEAGILMLADSVEASSRTLADPTPAKIQGLVQRMINKVFASGELDESNLTLKDLHLIAKSFTRVLTGIYHRRIEYSEPAEKVREKAPKPQADEAQAEREKPKQEGGEPRKDASRNNGEAGNGKRPAERASGTQDSSSGKETLKRLGIT